MNDYSGLVPVVLSHENENPVTVWMRVKGWVAGLLASWAERHEVFDQVMAVGERDGQFGTVQVSAANYALFCAGLEMRRAGYSKRVIRRALVAR